MVIHSGIRPVWVLHAAIMLLIAFSKRSTANAGSICGLSRWVSPRRAGSPPSRRANQSGCAEKKIRRGAAAIHTGQHGEPVLVGGFRHAVEIAAVEELGAVCRGNLLG